MNLTKRLRVRPGGRVRLKDWDPANTAGWSKDDATALLARNTARLAEWQYRLYAENRRALLVVVLTTGS